MHLELFTGRQRGSPASRDLAIQLACIRAFVAEHPRPDADTSLPLAAELPLRPVYSEAEFEKRKAWALGLSEESRKMVLTHLKQARALGPMRRVARVPQPSCIDAIETDFPHCAPVLEWIRQFVALGKLCPGQELSFPPLLLSGPPGTGKTALSQRLARALGTEHHTIDIASLHAGFTVSGLDTSYSTARPGLVWDALQHPCMSPLILLDELDKAADDQRRTPLGFLYQLLEPMTARRFVDAAIGLPLDASAILWIATCNEPAAIEPAIRSRFQEFEVPLPKSTQMPAVARSINREMLAIAPWGDAFDHELSPDILERVSAIPPRRVLHALRSAYATAALHGRRRLIASDVPLAPDAKRAHAIGFIHQ